MDLRSVLWKAVETKLGIEVSVSHRDLFSRKFYAERAKAREEGIFDFDCLVLVTPQPYKKDTWWIVKDRDRGQAQRKEQGKTGTETNPTV